jgi:hypothetical protein
VVILACNGVGTPRLLLNSRSARFPDGLANSARAWSAEPDVPPVGAAMHGYFDEAAGRLARPPAAASWSQEFYETDRARGFVRGYTSSSRAGRARCHRAHGHGTGTHPLGRRPSRGLRQLFDRIAGMVAICCEDLPEEHNTVTLDPELTDADGIRRPKITYRLSENSRRMLEHGWPAAPRS